MLIGGGAYVGGERVADPGLDEVGAWLDHPDAFVWLGLRMPNPVELSAVFEAFGVSGIEAADVVALHRRPVLSLEEGTFWLVLHSDLRNIARVRVTADFMADQANKAQALFLPKPPPP